MFNSTSDDADDGINYVESLDSLHFEIVMNLDINRQFIFSYLIDKRVFDQEDCELIINTASTRQQRVSKFLDIIKLKGENGVKHFVNALEYENPHLFKKFTGRDASAEMAPVISLTGAWDSISGLAAKEYIDADRAMLAKQLEHTSKDYHNATRLLNKAQHEKNAIEKKLLEAQQKNDMHQEQIKLLKSAVEAGKHEMSESMSPTEYFTRFESFQTSYNQEVFNRTNVIVVLQAKLLSQTEEIEALKNKNNELTTKLENTSAQMYDLAIVYDRQRKLTRKFSEQILGQSNEVPDDCVLENRQLKFQITCLHEECDMLKKDLEEFERLSEGLNAKYNVISEEKSILFEHREKMSLSYIEMEKQLKETQTLCRELKCDNAYMQGLNRQLQKDIKVYSNIQKAMSVEYERLRWEKDKALNLMKEMNDMMVESKEKSDAAIHEQIFINSKLNDSYKLVSEELQDVRNCWQQTNKEVAETKKQLASQRLSQEVAHSDIEAFTKKSDVNPKSDDHLHELKKRSNKELLDSMRRKFYDADADLSKIQGNSLDKLMSYERIQKMCMDSEESFDTGSVFIDSVAHADAENVGPTLRAHVRGAGHVSRDHAKNEFIVKNGVNSSVTIKIPAPCANLSSNSFSYSQSKYGRTQLSGDVSPILLHSTGLNSKGKFPLLIDSKEDWTRPRSCAVGEKDMPVCQKKRASSQLEIK